jgi:Tol biopolymer transport system component
MRREGWSRKMGYKLLKIVLCFSLGMTLFVFQFCSRDRSDDELPGSRSISAIDNDPSWSPDGNYLSFSYAPSEGSEGVGGKAPGNNICTCDLRTGKWTQITTDGNDNNQPDWIPVQEH